MLDKMNYLLASKSSTFFFFLNAKLGQSLPDLALPISHHELAAEGLNDHQLINTFFSSNKLNSATFNGQKLLSTN
jgi:hypothetical protein